MNTQLVESLMQIILSLPAEERLFLNEKITSHGPTSSPASTVPQAEEHVLQALIASGRIQPPLHCQDVPLISEAELQEMTQNLKISGKPLSETVIEDRVQLASALSVRDGISLPEVASYHFLTADDRLLAITQAEDLLVDNPNWHP
jgi:hypothetical protein